MNLELYTWWGLLQLLVVLFLVYWAIKLLVYLLERIGRKTVVNKSIVTFLKRTLLIYKPLAGVLLLLGFISINYITHSILLVVIGVFGYGHIKNYINGMIFQLNPLISNGASIIIEDRKGTLKSLLAFGVIINTEIGEHYMDYNTIEKLGFTIISNKENTLRQTLFLGSDRTKAELLDLLFDNPILNYIEEPTLDYVDDDDSFRLQFTLEKGASSEDLVSFLEGHGIIATFRKA